MQLRANLGDVLRKNTAIKPVHSIRNATRSDKRRNIYVSKDRSSPQKKDKNDPLKSIDMEEFQHLKVLFRQIAVK